ncbi:MAG: hypothetical protein LBR20_06460 [Propionibacteriaceae bacterium]|jgi:hypothetical protein|nr:hypothetical protein [Propionibacteriaceae bacterium]
MIRRRYVVSAVWVGVIGLAAVQFTDVAYAELPVVAPSPSGTTKDVSCYSPTSGTCTAVEQTSVTKPSSGKSGTTVRHPAVKSEPKTCQQIAASIPKKLDPSVGRTLSEAHPGWNDDSTGNQYQATDFMSIACKNADGSDSKVWARVGTDSSFRQVVERVNEEAVAERLFSQMDHEAIELVFQYPLENPILVGVPVWTWSDDIIKADKSKYSKAMRMVGPKTEQEGAVTLTAQITKVEIDWGDGSDHTVCSRKDLMEEWSDRRGFANLAHTRVNRSPGCDHIFYDTAKERTVTFTALWEGEWKGDYGSGVIKKVAPAFERVITVAEIQVIEVFD